jgi:Ca2+-binding EF-hand superfamily protein
MLIAQELKSLLDNEHKFNKFTTTAFKMADKDDSGQINSEELYSILYTISTDIGANPPSREDAKEIVVHLDTDRSGTISLNEFKTLIKDILKTMTDDENKMTEI